MPLSQRVAGRSRFRTRAKSCSPKERIASCPGRLLRPVVRRARGAQPRATLALERRQERVRLGGDELEGGLADDRRLHRDERLAPA